MKSYIIMDRIKGVDDGETYVIYDEQTKRMCCTSRGALEKLYQFGCTRGIVVKGLMMGHDGLIIRPLRPAGYNGYTGDMTKRRYSTILKGIGIDEENQMHKSESLGAKVDAPLRGVAKYGKGSILAVLAKIKELANKDTTKSTSYFEVFIFDKEGYEKALKLQDSAEKLGYDFKLADVERIQHSLKTKGYFSFKVSMPKRVMEKPTYVKMVVGFNFIYVYDNVDTGEKEQFTLYKATDYRLKEEKSDFLIGSSTNRKPLDEKLVRIRRLQYFPYDARLGKVLAEN